MTVTVKEHFVLPLTVSVSDPEAATALVARTLGPDAVLTADPSGRVTATERLGQPNDVAVLIVDDAEAG